MFTYDEWSNNKLSKEAKGREASKIVLRPSFWNYVVFTLQVMALLVHVVRLVDGKEKQLWAIYMKQWKKPRKQ